MNSFNVKIRRNSNGFTIVELLVVIAIIILIAAMLIPALGKAFATAKSSEDKTRLKGIHAALVLDATGNDGRFPLPSDVGKDHPELDPTLYDFTDTTSNLMSMMVARNYFKTDFLISPVETNPHVQDINAEDLVYRYDDIDGETVFWDDQFNADVSSGSASSLVHNSYAHQALCGQRIRLKWHSGSSSSDLILSNRGPESSVGPGGTLVYDEESNSLRFHGEDKIWKGGIVSGDGSVRIAQSYLPEGIAYQPLDGSPLGPDNIFLKDWSDVQVPFPFPADEIGLFSGDNWMVISTVNDVLPSRAIDFTAVWD
ncbi:MAG: prepilin-type N-terminal cleavage/methylation domain-containing protein [Planctomycetes bacterium]|nr:prepilin-type N-terminal cleavage/methylation domain-containing protein [Planctomycetota bacterium]